MLCVCDSQVYCTKEEEKTDSLFICQPHLLMTMMSETRFDCRSTCEKDIVFDALQKHIVEVL